MFRVLLVIFLVIRLSRIEFHRWQNFGHDWLIEFPRVRQLLLGNLRVFFLVIVAVKNRSPITRSDVSELSIRLGRIDLPPVNIEQLIVGDFGRIVSDLDRFPVACFFRRNEFVSGVRFGPAAITHDRFNHAFCLVECGLNAPKTAARQHRGSRFRRRRILFLVICDRACSNQRVAECRDKGSLHIVVVRHLLSRPVVNGGVR